MPKPGKDWARRRGRQQDKKNAGSAKANEVVQTIRKEAEEAGATLKNGGKGGLDPKLALKAFREADWKCENPNCPDPKKDLDLDHQSGHPMEIFEDPEAWKNPKARAAAKVGEKGDKKDDRFVHVLCAACHDAVHERERALENGDEPPPMPGAE